MHVSGHVRIALLVFALAVNPIGAQPGGQLVSGGFLYTQGAAPTSETSTSPATSFASALTQNWWYYRVEGDSRERPFGSYTKSDGFTIAGSAIYTPFPPGSNTVTYHWTENAAEGVRFTATYTTTLSSNGTTTANLAQSFQITNPNATQLTIALFNLADWSVNTGNAPGTIANGNINSITIDGGNRRAIHSAIGASAFEVAESPALRDLLLNSSVDDLNNSGVPFIGNYATDAFEWDLTVPANSSVTVQSFLASTPAVPEPGAIFLVGAAAIGALIRCRWARPPAVIRGSPRAAIS